MKREVLRDSMIIVKNIRGSNIAANRVIYATGNEDNVPTVNLAKADSTTTMPTIGVTIETITNNSYGRAIQVGLLEDINTNSLTEGDILYVSPTTAGVPTTTAPISPNLRQEIGTVLVKSITAGAIQIVARSMLTNYGITAVGTAQGQMVFWDNTLKQWVPTETSEMFWDDTNKRVGINKSSPTSRLDVGGTVTVTRLLAGGVNEG